MPPDAQPAPVAALPSPILSSWHKPAFILFLLLWVTNEVLLLLQIDLAPDWRWLEGAFLCLATLTTLLALARRLPLQNVLMAGVLIFSLATGLMAIAAVSGVPFGPFVYSERLGGKLFNTVPWSIPLIWILVIVNGRGVARLVMRPWRKTNYYGFWVIGLTCLFAVILDLGLEPFAVYVKDYWIWQASKSALSWNTAPWVNFLGWFVATLAIMAFTIPWLINKQPVKQAIDYHPLITWLLLNLWLITGNALHHLWLGVAVNAACCVAVTVFAIRGARW